MSHRGVKLDPEKLTLSYKRKGWSQQDLADKSGLDPRTISKVKRGGACDASTHLCLALALDIPPEELLLLPEPEFADPMPDRRRRSSDNGAPAVSFCLEQVWKVVDFREPATTSKRKRSSVAETSVTVWDYARIRQLDAQAREVVFPYLTWGDRIECELAPAEAEWRQVSVQPGDLVHSQKQWELRFPLPAAAEGQVRDCGPVKLRFIDAFHGEGQQWWQVRVGYPTESLAIQLLFSPARPCRSIQGSRALLGQREFESVEENQPQLLPDGAVAFWQVAQPIVGAFYKLAWAW